MVQELSRVYLLSFLSFFFPFSHLLFSWHPRSGRLLRGYLCRREERCSDGLQVPVQLRPAADRVVAYHRFLTEASLCD